LKRIEQFRDQDQQDSEAGVEPEPETKPYDDPVIYTAGRMEWKNGEDSSYRTCIKESQQPKTDATFVHPYETYLDHGGDVIDGCVAEDMEMINNADGLVAFFDSTDQTGTIVETVHAANQGMDILLLLSPNVYNTSKDIENYPRHVGSMSTRRVTPLWFLVNYLMGDGLVNRGNPRPQRIKLHPPMPARFAWDGVNCTTMLAQEGDGSVSRAIGAWLKGDLLIDTPMVAEGDEVIADE
jgi:hypothetical protein